MYWQSPSDDSVSNYMRIINLFLIQLLLRLSLLVPRNRFSSSPSSNEREAECQSEPSMQRFLVVYDSRIDISRILSYNFNTSYLISDS